MLRLCIGLALLSLVSVTRAAQSDEDFFAPRVNLLTTRFVHAESDLLPAYQFSATILLNRLPEAAPAAPGFSNISLSPLTNPQQDSATTTNSHWQSSYEGGRTSLARLFRVEFKVQQANVALRPNSISLEGERFKITFHPRSALIEGEGIKLLLQPNAATMQWSKAF